MLNKITFSSIALSLALILTANAQGNEGIIQHPLTDKLNCEVYDFVVEYLSGDGFHYTTRQQAIEQNKLHQEDEAAIRAGENFPTRLSMAHEGQMGNILDVFCKNTSNCKSIALYMRNGMLVKAATTRVNSIDYQKSVDFMIPSNIYDKYANGELIKPQTYKNDKQVLYPIYKRADGYGTHTKESAADKLIGFIVYEYN